MTEQLFVRFIPAQIIPLRWDEVRDVAISIVHAFWTLRDETCPDCMNPWPNTAVLAHEMRQKRWKLPQ